MRIPTIPLCQCSQCRKPHRHRRYIGRHKEAQKRNKKIRYQNPDLVRMTIEEIYNREIKLPRTGRYTD